MQVSVRSYLTAGVAMFGAAAIAIAPTQALPTNVAATADETSSRSVALTAGFDPITPWLDVWNTSEVNFADLVNLYLEAPAPVIQQVVANQLRYLSELPDIGSIAEQIVTNAAAAIEAPFVEDLSTLSPGHVGFYQGLLDEVPESLQPLVALTTTYLSGALFGLVGPVIGPILALGASIESIVENLFTADPDFEAALNDLVNIPANMTNAFFNGGPVLDLTPLVSLLNVELPGGTELNSSGITMGGLFSPGGSFFNAMDVSLTMEGVPFPINIAGEGPGTIGSLIGLTQAIAKAIGWNGQGNPLQPATPPVEEESETGDPSAAMLVSSVNSDPADSPAESAAAILQEDTSTDSELGEVEEDASGGAGGNELTDEEAGEEVTDELTGEETGGEETSDELTDEEAADELTDEEAADELANEEAEDGDLGGDQVGDDETGNDSTGSDTNGDSTDDAGDSDTGDSDSGDADGGDSADGGGAEAA